MYIILALLFPTLAFSFETKIQPLELPLTKVTNHGKSLTLTVGLGSGAFHPISEPDIVYFVTDRGPNLPQDLARDLLNVKLSDKKGYIFPEPKYTPTIYKVKLSPDKYEILETIKIKDDQGKELTGLPTPNADVGIGLDGKPLPYDPQGLDSEAIVKLKDGTFYISDEYLPSILHVDSNGKLLKRLIPGNELPVIVAKNWPNRGIEALALSPDEQYLYYALQSPLRHPDGQGRTKTSVLRFFRLNIGTQKTDQQYAYLLDDPKTFRDDNVDVPNDVKVSEMTMIDADQLLVLENISKTTKLYVVKISSKNNIDSKWNDEQLRPALEQLDDAGFKKAKIKILSKKLLLDSADLKDKLPLKMEGMTYLGNDEWLLVNDNDFGITGEKTQLIRIKLPMQK